MRFVENYQTKMLSMTVDEAVRRGSVPGWVRVFADRREALDDLRHDEAFLEAVARQLADGTARSAQSFTDRAPTELVEVDEARL